MVNEDSPKGKRTIDGETVDRKAGAGFELPAERIFREVKFHRHGDLRK
ncbi:MULTISPECIES: hypothetical protein [unclassified Mesorhizobium]|nr:MULTISPECIES: hypothetical protein [unclassified Mesorhizobium]